MLIISNKQDCCGCGACVQRCPKKCISLHEDNEGFLYPEVDADVCVDCGICEKVCPFVSAYDKRKPIQTIAAMNKDEDVRMQSSSGGVFSVLAESVLNEGGVVFGARFDENWQVTLDSTETVEGLAAFRGSKYVQARTGDTYRQCEAYLKSGRKVLYAGTPCQVAGLKHFLRKEYDNLLAVDFACHGVPSPKVWYMYLNEIVGVAEAKGISMQEKQDLLKRMNFVLDYNNDNQTYTLSSLFYKNDYLKALVCGMTLRPSCNACKAKELRSNSDITIADYWGIQDVCPEMDDEKGTGLVLINSEKGKEALDVSRLKYKETTFEEGYRFNPAINGSAKPCSKREHFFNQLDTTDSVIILIRKYLRLSIKAKIRLCLRFLLSVPKRIICKLFKKPTLPEYKELVVTDITFRSKSKGWKHYQLQLTCI